MSKDNAHLTEEEQALLDVTPVEDVRATAPQSALLTPEQVQMQVRTQVGTVGTQVGNEIAGTIAFAVGEQIALNVIQKLPDAIAYSGEVLGDFFTGVNNSEDNPFLPTNRPISQFLPSAGR